MPVVYVTIREYMIMAWMEESKMVVCALGVMVEELCRQRFGRGLHPGISHEDCMVKKNKVFNRAVEH